ncbi:MAG: HlyD family efflux transporter periplasmic adaptor subunit [Chloroflexi bacterium]|nr:HlyD family efflux transporter periplasmic adaptor subunit [Chloroflexota bacterium]MBP7041410.1 HlyD family efflux transporter periplasmic adaptor subunit [Chloroflexota bacterium]
MNVKRAIIGVIVIVVLLGAGYFAYQQFLAPEPAVDTAETVVDPNTISVETNLDLVTAEGQITPLQQTILSFQTGGQLTGVLVAEGDVVAVGDPLLQLDTTDQALAVTQAEAALVQANANLTTASAGLLAAQTGIQAADVAVQAAQANLALTQAGPTAAQIALSEQSVAAAEASINLAAGNRSLSLQGPTSAEIQAAEAQVAAAQAQFVAAQKQFEPVSQNVDADTAVREEARLQLVAAQANVNAAQAALAELRAGPIAAAQTAANSSVAAASSQRDASEAQLALVKLGASEEQIAVAEASVVSAQKRAMEAELRVIQAETAVTQAQAAVTEAETALTSAQTVLARRTLSAPFAGTVANIGVKANQVIAAGAPVLTLADFGGWQVETTDLSEISVVAIENGFTADVTIDAFPGETLRGTIIDIASASDIVRGDVTYKVTLALEDGITLPLRWGMTAFVSIDTNQ